MKLTLGLAAALAGCSAATAQPAGQVFTFPSRSSSSTASLGRSEAHLVFLQRLASPNNEPSILDIPTDINGDRAVELITKYGREIPGLFDDDSSKNSPRRLMVMIEGMTQKQMKASQKALKAKPAFSIHDPPSAAANEELFEDDLFTVDAKPKAKCSLADVLKMNREECWNKQSTAVKVNVEQTPAQLDDMLRDLAMLSKLANDGKVESTVVFIPTADEVSNAAYWSDMSAELRRRQSEAVMTAPGIETSSSTNAPGTVHKITAAAAAKHKKILACYATVEDCNAATASCSGHGKCVDKNHHGDSEKKLRRADELEACFACQCSTTSDKTKNSTTTWAGPACSKMDVSSPFWLFVSASVVVVFAVYMAVGMLFAVGDEKLPGVIGAGVSKSK